MNVTDEQMEEANALASPHVTDEQAEADKAFVRALVEKLQPMYDSVADTANATLRSLWCAADTAGGSLRISNRSIAAYNKDAALVQVVPDPITGDHIVMARTRDNPF